VGRSLFIYILRPLGFVRLTIDVATAFLLPTRASESPRNTTSVSMSLFLPRKAIKEQGWDFGSARVLSTGLVARFASGVHSALVAQAPVSLSFCLLRKLLSHRFAEDTSGETHVRRRSKIGNPALLARRRN